MESFSQNTWKPGECISQNVVETIKMKTEICVFVGIIVIITFRTLDKSETWGEHQS